MVTGIATQPCDDGRCSDLLSAEGWATTLEAGVMVDGAPLDPTGLSDAIAEMARLLR